MPTIETVAPAFEPLTTAEVKTHLRVSLTDEDTYIGSYLIPTARRHAEHFARRVFISRSFRQEIDGISWQYGLGGYGTNRYFRPQAIETEGAWVQPHFGFQTPVVIESTPLRSVTTLEYYAPSATSLSTLASSNYYVDTVSEPGQLRLALGSVWPAVEPTRHDAVRITTVCGYSTTSSSVATAVPDEYRWAMLLICAHLYEHRGDEAKMDFVIPPAAQSLLRPTRNFRFV